MRKATPVLFFVAAAIFMLNGGIGILRGDTNPAIWGVGQGAFWFVLGFAITRKQSMTRV